MKYSFEAIGTHWEIEWENDAQVDAEKIISTVLQRIERFDQTYSRFREDSVILQMSRQAGSWKLPADADPLFDLYFKLYQATNGIITPLVGQLLSDAGYDQTYSLTPKQLQPVPRWEDVIHYKTQVLTLSQPAILDFGAAGKGYLVDIVADLLLQEGIASFTVDGSGDIKHCSSTQSALRVGLEHPDNPKQVLGVLELSNHSLCSSSGNRRAWSNFHHIINPQTHQSPRDVLATWVLAPTTILADAVATALFLVPPQQLSSLGPFEYLIMFDNHTVKKSLGFAAELFFA